MRSRGEVGEIGRELEFLTKHVTENHATSTAPEATPGGDFGEPPIPNVPLATASRISDRAPPQRSRYRRRRPPSAIRQRVCPRRATHPTQQRSPATAEERRASLRSALRRAHRMLRGSRRRRGRGRSSVRVAVRSQMDRPSNSLPATMPSHRGSTRLTAREDFVRCAPGDLPARR